MTTMQYHPHWTIRISLPAVLSIWLISSALGQTPQDGNTHQGQAEDIVLPQSTPDPIEPFNRVMWEFNRGVMIGIIKPTSRVYRYIIVKPVRNRIANFGRNLTYPGRLINNLLQGKWAGARDESYRFACNSTVGLAGMFDVAEKWNIHKSEADFGQTFGQWGWKPACFIMLPFLGPSNERDFIGYAADTAADPLIYISPYKFVADNPLTYLGPYTYFTYLTSYNGLSDSVGEYARFAEAEMDPYSEIQYAWTFARENRVADFKVNGTPDPATLETLESVFFSYKDPEFPNRATTRSALIPSTGRRLQFTCWLQPGQAPVVYIAPGLGAHRLDKTSIALAELAYTNGFSAVCVSSVFHSEFMERASTAAMPGYLPVDGRDFHVALTEIDRRLNALYPKRLGKRALMGYSMGALHALFIAGTATNGSSQLLKFDRYVAINAPVRLLYGVSKLDEFYNAPLSWPPVERSNNMENTFLKVAALSKDKLTPQTSLPFSAIESKFLIGMTFRFTLRDIIYNSQRRNNQGVLRHSILGLSRTSLYSEILRISFKDYFDKFVIPYYQTRGSAELSPAAIEGAEDLRTCEAGLAANPGIRIITNQNDFLLADGDIAWLQSVFSTNALTIFKQGGHMGNLSNPAVQKAILRALDGLNSPALVTASHNN